MLYLVSCHTSHDGKLTARRAIKRFDHTFSKGGWHPQPIRPPEAVDLGNIPIADKLNLCYNE